jgi:hypothetical protein
MYFLCLLYIIYIEIRTAYAPRPRLVWVMNYWNSHYSKLFSYVKCGNLFHVHGSRQSKPVNQNFLCLLTKGYSRGLKKRTQFNSLLTI